MDCFNKITKDLEKLQATVKKLLQIEKSMNELLHEETLDPALKSKYIGISTADFKKKKSSPVKATFVDSIYAPKWAKGSNKTYKKQINSQASLAGTSIKPKIVPQKSTKVQWINVGKDEVIEKFEYGKKTYLMYKTDLFTEKGEHVGSLSGGNIKISDKEVVLTNTPVLELEKVPDCEYYKCKGNFAYEISGGLAKRIGEVKDGDVYAYA
jgi:hypothetical protein